MSESPAHKKLKKKAVGWLKNKGFSEENIETEYSVGTGDKEYIVDVVYIGENESIAIECGKIGGNRKYKERKINFLKEKFDKFKRFSYLKVKESRRQKETYGGGGEIVSKSEEGAIIDISPKDIYDREVDDRGRISLPTSLFANKKLRIAILEELDN